MIDVTGENGMFIKNSDSEQPQNKISVSLTKENEIWVVKLHNEKGDSFKVYEDVRFGVAHYYADYFKHLIGFKVCANDKPPKCWNYDDKILVPSPEFDFNEYSGKNFLDEGQQYVQVTLCSFPESNRRFNWSVVIYSNLMKFYEATSFICTEHYFKALDFYFETLHILGQAQKPVSKTTDLRYRNSKTGEFFTP